jgi:hypothetical protein
VSGCTCDHNPHKASCPSYGEDYLAHPDTPVRVDWWWTAEGRAAHDAAIRAEALREAADRLSGRAPIIVNDLPANATRREWAAAWLRGRAMAVDDVPTLARADAALRAAQPTEGEAEYHAGALYGIRHPGPREGCPYCAETIAQRDRWAHLTEGES